MSRVRAHGCEAKCGFLMNEELEVGSVVSYSISFIPVRPRGLGKNNLAHNKKHFIVGRTLESKDPKPSMHPIRVISSPKSLKPNKIKKLGSIMESVKRKSMTTFFNPLIHPSQPYPSRISQLSEASQ